MKGNIGNMMKQAQMLQANMQKAQAEITAMEVTGESGGGMVKIRASAKGRIIAVSIDDSLMQPSEKSMLEDLIAAALNDARGKADAAAGEQMQALTGGMQLPPGLKLPF